MPFGEAMKLPISVFWTLSSHIERLRAEEELRLHRAMSFSHGGEGVQDFVENLNSTVGKVMVVDPIVTAVRDESGFDDLKRMAAGMIG